MQCKTGRYSTLMIMLLCYLSYVYNDTYTGAIYVYPVHIYLYPVHISLIVTIIL